MRLFVALLFDLQGGPVTEAGYSAAVASLLGVPQSIADVLITRYPVADYASPGLALSALATDAAFACNALAADRYLSSFVPTYAYEFEDATAPQLFIPPASFPYGAYHASEIQYLFNVPSPFPPQPLDGDQQRLSDAMVRYWARFARSGKPIAPRAVRWPRFDTEGMGGAHMMSLVSPAPAVKPASFFQFDHQCGFWDSILGN
jgi:para-nitrobenzyl esterase